MESKISKNELEVGNTHLENVIQALEWYIATDGSENIKSFENTLSFVKKEQYRDLTFNLLSLIQRRALLDQLDDSLCDPVPPDDSGWKLHSLAQVYPMTNGESACFVETWEKEITK